ncbi:MAG: A/G-specific adenine glycosylase [Pirellulales bacterium]|nr:A/G-specific adenine glycosylase [Pirellulales bacterium]
MPLARPARRPKKAIRESLLPGVGDSAWRRALRARLAAWYGRHARKLPWRETRDPYNIWISETMLQQTQVVTVIPYYERFLATFPTVTDLAGADEQQVLRLWEGLGYYRRARQLHQAAKVIRDYHGGEFPNSYDAVLALPGVGRYTAGAVLSFAWDQRLPILEANTLRAVSRLLAYQSDPRGSEGQRLLWQAAEDWLPRRQAGRFNQALMELGSQVCLPRSPLCDKCPVATLCPTQKLNLQDSIPRPPRRPATQQVREAMVVVRRRGQVLLVRRGATARWAGMWDFPRFEISGPSPDEIELRRSLDALTDVDADRFKPLTTLQHGVTRFRITLDCFSAQYKAAAPLSRPEEIVERRWVSPSALDDYPLSVTARRLARHWIREMQRG